MITKDSACRMRKRMNRDRTLVIRAIKRFVSPYLHGSGYVKHSGKFGVGDSRRYIQLAHFGSYGESSKREGEAREYTNAELDLSIQGFTEDGIISDSYCAIATMDYRSLGLNTLLWVHDIAHKHHGKLE